jgi:hypothetical protein
MVDRTNVSPYHRQEAAARVSSQGERGNEEGTHPQMKMMKTDEDHEKA